MMMPLAWPEIQMNGGGQLVQEQWINESLAQPDWVREDDECDLLTPENSLLSYDSGNSDILQGGFFFFFNLLLLVHETLIADCEVYNLGTGKATSVLEMVKAFEKASGKKILLVMAGR